MAHMCILFLCVYKDYSAIEQCIKLVAHHEGTHIHSYSFSWKTCIVHHKHAYLQLSSILSTSTHTHTHACMDARKHIRMHAWTHASTYTWCLLRLAPTVPCIRLVIVIIVWSVQWILWQWKFICHPPWWRCTHETNMYLHLDCLNAVWGNR